MLAVSQLLSQLLTLKKLRNTAARSNQIIYIRDPLDMKNRNLERNLRRTRLRNAKVLHQGEMQHYPHSFLPRAPSKSSGSCHSTSSNDLSSRKSKKKSIKKEEQGLIKGAHVYKGLMNSKKLTIKQRQDLLFMEIQLISWKVILIPECLKLL